MSKLLESYTNLMDYYSELIQQGVEIDVMDGGKSACTMSEIHELVQALGYPIGDELIEWLRMAYPKECTSAIWLGGNFFEDEDDDDIDEQDPGWETHLHLSAESILTHYKEDIKFAEELNSIDSIEIEDTRLKHAHANKRWIPIGFCTLGEYALYIDMDPSPQGDLGQIISGASDSSCSYVIAASLAEFLTVVLDCHKKALEWSDVLQDTFEQSRFCTLNKPEISENDEALISPDFQEEDDRELAQELNLSLEEYILLRDMDHNQRNNYDINTLADLVEKIDFPGDPETDYIGLTLISSNFLYELEDSIKKHLKNEKVFQVTLKLISKMTPLLQSNEPNVNNSAKHNLGACFKICFMGGLYEDALNLIPYASKADKRFALTKINKIMSDPLAQFLSNAHFREAFIKKLESE